MAKSYISELLPKEYILLIKRTSVAWLKEPAWRCNSIPVSICISYCLGYQSSQR